MAEFRFKIGEVVTTKAGIAEATLACQGGVWVTPKPLTVISRYLEECHGGTQVHYFVRLGQDAVLMNDSELAPLSDFDVAKVREISTDATLGRWLKEFEYRKAHKPTATEESTTK